MVAAALVWAETDERARFLAAPARCRSCGCAPAARRLPSPEEAAAYPYTELERAFVEDRLATQIVGITRTVQRGIPTSSTPPRPTS